MKIIKLAPLRKYNFIAEAKEGLDALHDFKAINHPRRSKVNRDELIDDGYTHANLQRVANGQSITVKLDDRSYQQKRVSEANKGYAKNPTGKGGRAHGTLNKYKRSV